MSIINLIWLSTWNTSGIISDLASQGRYLPSIRCTIVLPRTTYQEVSTVFDTSRNYTLLDSGFNNTISPYFDLYIEYRSIDPTLTTKVKGIIGIVKPK